MGIAQQKYSGTLISLTMIRSMMDRMAGKTRSAEPNHSYTVVTMDLRQLRQTAVLDKLGTARIVKSIEE